MISPEEAMRIARDRAKELGWGLMEPLRVLEWKSRVGPPVTYKVDSDPTMRGTKTRFTIDASTGAILEEGYIPR